MHVAVSVLPFFGSFSQSFRAHFTQTWTFQDKHTAKTSRYFEPLFPLSPTYLADTFTNDRSGICSSFYSYISSAERVSPDLSPKTKHCLSYWNSTPGDEDKLTWMRILMFAGSSVIFAAVYGRYRIHPLIVLCNKSLLSNWCLFCGWSHGERGGGKWCLVLFFRDLFGYPMSIKYLNVVFFIFVFWKKKLYVQSWYQWFDC